MKKLHKLKIVFVGGSTAGHVKPAILIWRYLNSHFNLEYRFIISGSRIEKEMTKLEGIETTTILSGKHRRYFSVQNFIDIFKIIIGFFQAFFRILFFSPHVVFAKGGYLSVPVVIAARICGKKVVIHESDITLGLANRINSRFSNAIVCAFPKSEYPKKFHKKIHSLGIPTDFDGSRLKTKSKAINILIIGGSLGAKTINDAIKEILPSLLEKFRVTHITGKNQYFVFKDFKKSLNPKQRGNYLPIGFVPRGMDEFYKNSNLVIGRGGATTLFELALHGLPAITIPLGRDKSRGDQIANVKFFKNKEAIKVIYEEELTPNFLFQEIIQLLNNKSLLEKLSKNIKLLSTPNALKEISSLIVYFARK